MHIVIKKILSEIEIKCFHIFLDKNIYLKKYSIKLGNLRPSAKKFNFRFTLKGRRGIWYPKGLIFTSHGLKLCRFDLQHQNII